MAVPFRRTSKMKKRLRRTHFKLNVCWYDRMSVMRRDEVVSPCMQSMRIIQRQRHKCKK